MPSTVTSLAEASTAGALCGRVEIGLSLCQRVLSFRDMSRLLSRFTVLQILLVSAFRGPKSGDPLVHTTQAGVRLHACDAMRVEAVNMQILAHCRLWTALVASLQTTLEISHGYGQSYL